MPIDEALGSSSEESWNTLANALFRARGKAFGELVARCREALQRWPSEVVRRAPKKWWNEVWFDECDDDE